MIAMLILVNGATKTVARHPECGVLLSPRAGNSIDAISTSGRLWAADNDAFGAWDEDRYWKMLVRISKVDRSRLLWVVAPDAVGDSQGTLNLWHHWYRQINALGIPVAFVGQDGLEDKTDQVQWHEIDCFFVGGSTEWKLSRAAEELCREAKRLGKWVHVGRVNTRVRIQHAVEIGADSIDGTTFSRWPDKYIPKGLGWVKSATHQTRFI